MISSLAVVLWLALAASVSAGDPQLDQITSDGAIAFQVSDVQGVIEHRLVEGLYNELLDSPTLELFLTAPDAQMGYEQLEAAEAAWGCTWQEAYSRLIANGVYGKLTRTLPPHVLTCAAASDEEIVAATVALAKQYLDDQAAAGADVNAEMIDYRGHIAIKTNEGMFIAIGNRMLFSDDEATLKAAADQVLDTEITSIAGTGSSEGEFGHIRVDLTALRLVPDFATALVTPAQEPGAAFFLGGWLDLARRYDEFSVTFSREDTALRTAVAFSKPNGQEPAAALNGFWADTAEETPAPLLDLPNTIFSTSIYRDYSALWSARGDLLASNVVETIDQGDEDISQTLAVLGLQNKPSDIIHTIGPRWRFVAVKADESPYPDIPVTDLLPAWAIVVELSDPDEFWRMVSPVTRTLNLILSGEQRFTIEQQPCGDGEVTVLSVDQSDQAVRQKNQVEYNFRVTYGVVHNHAIIGSTPAVVHQVAEALAAEQAEGATSQNAGLVAERQYFSGESLAAMLDGFHDAAVRSWVLNTGVGLDQAEEEWERIVRMTAMLGQVEGEARFEEDGFVYEFTMSPDVK
jgi:hypothetical protein